MLTFTPSADFPMPSAAVQTELYNFVEALRVADAKAELANVEFDERLASKRESYLRIYNIDEAQAAARLFAGIFQEIIDGAPSIPDRVFTVIRDYENYIPWNTPHVEGLVLALELAFRSIESAMQIAAEENDEADELAMLMLAADHAIECNWNLLEGAIANIRDDKLILQKVLDGEALPDRLENLRDLIDASEKRLAKYPNGIEHMITVEEMAEEHQILLAELARVESGLECVT